MRWRDQRQSTNIEDRRGLRGPAMIGGGVLVLAIAIHLCGGAPGQLLQNSPIQAQVREPGTANRVVSQDENRQFVGAVMGHLEDVWRQILPAQARMRLREPQLVLFTDQIASACGYANSASGPLYCPGDRRIYLDFAFFDELKRKLKTPADFAQAYVIAHEYAHHIQNQTGIMDKVQPAANGNRLSVALELQADCFAGIWAKFAAKQGLVDAGDAEEAIRATAAVGDDMIQRRTQGYVLPDFFTHSSVRQRMQYFAKGMQSGDMRQCETLK